MMQSVEEEQVEGASDADWDGLDDEDAEDFSDDDLFPTKLGQGHGFIELYLEDAGVELDAAGFWLVPRWMVDGVDGWIDENLRARRG